MEAFDVLPRRCGEVLAQLVGVEPPARPDRAQERERRRPRADADLDHPHPRPDVTPEQERPDVLRIDRLGLAGQPGDELWVRRAQDEQRSAARRLDGGPCGAPDQRVAGERPSTYGNLSPGTQAAEVHALLAVDEEHGLVGAERAGAGLESVDHDEAIITPPARRVSTSRTRRQKEQSPPNDGIPQLSQAPGGDSTESVNRGWATRPKSLTKRSLLPGDAASMRLSASL